MRPRRLARTVSSWTQEGSPEEYLRRRTSRRVPATENNHEHRNNPKVDPRRISRRVSATDEPQGECLRPVNTPENSTYVNPGRASKRVSERDTEPDQPVWELVNFTPIRTGWIVTRPGWRSTPRESVLCACCTKIREATYPVGATSSHYPLYKLLTCRIQNPDIPRRVGTGRRTAGRRGRAGTGSTGRRRDGSPRRKPPLLPSRRWKNSRTCLA